MMSAPNAIKGSRVLAAVVVAIAAIRAAQVAMALRVPSALSAKAALLVLLLS